MMIFRRFLFAVLLAIPLAAQAVQPLATFDVILLQPDELMKARVPDIDGFAAYIKALQAEIGRSIPGPGAANSGFIVVAVRPGGRSNVWLDLDDPLNEAVSDRVVKQVRGLPAPRVQGGPVVFALKVGIWGGKESRRVAPSPREWRDAAAKAGHALDAGDLVESIWQD